MEFVAVEIFIKKINYDPLEKYNKYEHDPKDIVCEKSTEDIDFIVDLSAAEEVEDLEEDEDIEDKG